MAFLAFGIIIILLFVLLFLNSLEQRDKRKSLEAYRKMRDLEEFEN